MCVCVQAQLTSEQAQRSNEDLRSQLKEEQDHLEEMRRERDAARVDRALDQVPHQNQPTPLATS